MVLWAAFQSQMANKVLAPPQGPSYLIQGLDPDDIGSIVLGKGQDQLTLKRQGGRFVVVSKDGYPAEIDQINDLITRCLDVKTVELSTSDPSNHSDLGVTEDAAETIVKFLKRDGSLLTGLLLGKDKERGQGAYIRLASSDSVYLTLDRPFIRTMPTDYIDQTILSLSRDDIDLVSVKSADGKYTIKPGPEPGDIVLETLEEGKKIKENECRGVFGALGNLMFDDVKKADNFPSELTFDRRYVAKLKDSTVYTLVVAKTGDKFYIKCKADFTDKTPVKKKNVVESEEELKKKEAKLQARDAAKIFTENHKGWVYEISISTAANLTMTKSELTEDIEKEEVKE